MRITQRNNYGYIFMIVLALTLLLWAIPNWSPPWPGYGMPASLLPNILSVFILIMASLGLAANILKHERPSATCEKRQGLPAWAYLAMFVLPCALLMPAIALAGFIPAGIAFMLLIQWLCGQRKIIAMALVSVLPVLLCWAAMRYALGVPMP